MMIFTIFGIVVVLSLISIKLANQKNPYYVVVKVLTTSVVMFGFFQVSYFSSHKLFTGLILTGIIFSVVGDYLTAVKEDLYGGLSFSISYSLYLTAFVKTFSLVNNIYYVIGILLILNYLIYSKINTDKTVPKILIGIYTLIHTLMVSSAVNFSLQTSIFQFALGTFLLYISDLTIAYNEFVKSLENRNEIVLSTYWLGQFLILWGCFKFETC